MDIEKRPTAQDVKGMLKEWLRFKGRMSRLDFLLVVMCEKSIRHWLDAAPESLWMIGLIGALLLAYLHVCFVVARFHDIGLSGFWAIPVFIAGLWGAFFIDANGINNENVIIFLSLAIISIALMVWPRQKRENKYGPYRKYGFSAIKII